MSDATTTPGGVAQHEPPDAVDVRPVVPWYRRPLWLAVLAVAVVGLVASVVLATGSGEDAERETISGTVTQVEQTLVLDDLDDPEGAVRVSALTVQTATGTLRVEVDEATGEELGDADVGPDDVVTLARDDPESPWEFDSLGR
jgi:hypothetical protein